jgi:hypothetical protein
MEKHKSDLAVVSIHGEGDTVSSLYSTTSFPYSLLSDLTSPMPAPNIFPKNKH